MHRISETFVHRDIKSFNFLVDAQLVVKVADLELGSSSAEELGDPVNQNLRSANGGIVDLFRSSMMMSSWQAPEVLVLFLFFFNCCGSSLMHVRSFKVKNISNQQISIPWLLSYGKSSLLVKRSRLRASLVHLTDSEGVINQIVNYQGE